MAFDRTGNVLVCEEAGHRVWRLAAEDPAERRSPGPVGRRAAGRRVRADGKQNRLA
jgi:hypothetical protein